MPPSWSTLLASMPCSALLEPPLRGRVQEPRAPVQTRRIADPSEEGRVRRSTGYGRPIQMLCVRILPVDPGASQGGRDEPNWTHRVSPWPADLQERTRFGAWYPEKRKGIAQDPAGDARKHGRLRARTEARPDRRIKLHDREAKDKIHGQGYKN